MEPGPGDAAAEGRPASRPRRRRSLRRLLHRFLLALGSRSRPGDSPPRSQPHAQLQPGHCDGDGEGGFACTPGPTPAAPGSPGVERSPALQHQLPAGDGARPPGAQGLKNHGNTCFMNAVVQCLSNTDLLAEFLALGRYRAAPGRAEVTEQLAALVRALWTREYTPQLSAEFKNAVSKYGSQFQGNSQHDALEFLLWLLDRVHEDLEGSSRGPVSEKSLKRRKSVIRDPIDAKAFEVWRACSVRVGPPICRRGRAWADARPGSTCCVCLSVEQALPGGVSLPYETEGGCGIVGSSLTCPHCLKQSNTFDPFLCVSLPIPLRQTRFLSVTLVFPCKSQRFLRVGLAVPILSTVAALRKLAAEEGGVPAEEVILVELYPNGFQRSFFDEEDLNTIAEGDNVYAFQVPPPPSQGTLSARPAGLPIVSPRLGAQEGQRFSLPLQGENKVPILFCNLVGSGQHASRFGPPFLIREDRTISWAQLQQCILSKVRYLMRSEAPAQNLGSLFSIRVVGLSLACSYLSPQDSRPLCHWAVDRALHLRRPGGPPHVKLAVEWDCATKECLFGSLQEEQVPDADSVRRQQQAHQQHSCTLDECFQFYTKEEQLAQDDAWKCPHCRVLQQGVVKLSLWTLPDILIIHLKRFCQVGERRNKLSTLIKFPLSGLNMAPHVAQRSTNGKPLPGPWPSWKQPASLPAAYPLDFLYDLYAVCNHHGSLQGGHYTESLATGNPYSILILCEIQLLEILYMGGLESRPLVRGGHGRSISMKAPTTSRARQGPFKTMPLRWSFGHREKQPGASVELVEYLESRRRPRRSTSHSIVSLLTGTAGGEEKSASPKPNGTLSGEDGGQANGRGPARVPCLSGYPSHHPASDVLNTTRAWKENASQDIRLPKKFDLPLTVMSNLEREKPARPEGQKNAGWKGSQSGPPSPSTGLFRNCQDSGQGTLPKMRADMDERASEKDRLPQGTLTLLRSVFRKKENGKIDRTLGLLPSVSQRSGRLSPAVDEQAPGSSPALRIPEGLARSLGSHLERDVRSAPSSLHLPRKAGRPPRPSAASFSQKSVPGEQTSYGTLQRVKYHTLSLGRKKTLPESSF
ncbi:ubiquitin carboxyl-terminal hydrolase 43 [Octodon degus]|uniref:ubiquitinyl hydrolase 1 n=1 Tax=Octodon degus TaxID=10160 RepID=A0A6P3VDU1_OCTDE|nr:ubiquitin carboxyl-terminal hydrolase 43 [Octodon degus]